MKQQPGIVAAALACAMLAACAAQDGATGNAPAEQEGIAGDGYGVDTDARWQDSPGAPAEGAGPLPLDTGRLVTTEIVDRAGFGRPVTAWRLQGPAGWQTTGGVIWNDGANCHSNMVQTGWSAIAPDGISTIEVMPGFAWQVAGTEIPTDPCPVAAYRTAREFLAAAAQQSRPGARILDYVEQPDWARLAQQRSDEQMRRMGEALAPGQTRTVEAGSVLLAFQQDGIEMREVLSAVVSFVSLGGHRNGSAGTVVSYRAPHGRLDMALAERVATTLEQDPQWLDLALPRLKRNVQAYFSGQRRQIDEWHSRQMAIINARGMADRHAIRMRNSREVAGIYSAIAASTSATSDAIHRRGLEAVGEYDTYVGSAGTTVQSSIHGGSRVFQDTHDPGRAYSTDDPRPDPPSGYVELERMP